MHMAQRLCVLQHADGEGLGSMRRWFAERDFEINIVRIDRGAALPAINSFDWLILMGGPMGVYEELQYPWLATEKIWLKEAIDAEKKILGICLGAQLIASAMGAPVYPNESSEIGWFPITRTDASVSWLPQQSHLFSWHGDCFEVPAGAKPFASSEATPCQGFRYGNRVWALQFHVETEAETASVFYEAAGGDLPYGEFVQDIAELETSEYLAESAKVATDLLNYLAKQ
jgi:GMP synthase-like glutamine amidotransferase